MTLIIRDCVERNYIYGILKVNSEKVTREEVIEKIEEIKYGFDEVGFDWGDEDIINELPKEWKCEYTTASDFYNVAI
jgi:hypothetical protein